MVSLRRSLSRAALLAAIVLPATVAGAQEGYRDHYRAGREAFEAGEWEEAVKALRLALEERQNERSRILGMPFGRYLPRYYLGVALAELGRCSAALEVFEEADADGAITKVDDLYAVLEGKRAACRERIESLRRALQSGRKLLEEARSLAQSVSDRMQNPILGTPDAEATLGRARERMATATAALRTAAVREDPAAADRAAAVARAAKADLEELLRVMVGREAAAREFTEAKRDRVAELVAQGRMLVERSRELEPLPSSLAVRVSALARTLARAATSQEIAIGSLESLERSLGRQVADLREALRPPPEALAAAAQAYLEGDFEAVVDLLEGVGRGPGRVAAHACLLRVASWVTLAARTGQQDLLDRAAREVDACPDLEEHVELSSMLFSPSVIGFIERAVRARNGPPVPAEGR